MKKLYSMILLMSAMSVCGPEKALTTKLRNDYDLQLAQRKAALESRKLLESVAKKQKKGNIRNTHQKNKNEQSEQKQNKKFTGQYRSYEPSIYSRLTCMAAWGFVGTIFGTLAYKKFVLGMPIDCIPVGYGVMKCLDV